MSIFLRGHLTVYFEDPFWVGIFERVENDMLEVSKVTFGPEPKDYEVYAFVNQQYKALRFSKPIKELQKDKEKKVNPKRLQRQIKKVTKEQGIRTKAQEAIQLEREAHKVERKKKSKEERILMKQAEFEKKQEKKKQRKRGH